jgi:hypothetical protein
MVTLASCARHQETVHCTGLSHSQGFRIRVWNGPSCIMCKASRDCALTTLSHSQGFRIRVWNFVDIDAKLLGSACPLYFVSVE